jgi:hypothetical protein
MWAVATQTPSSHVACSKGPIPEKESLARLTLCHPLTFESLGDAALGSFKGRALRYLAEFRLRSFRDFASKLKSFFESSEGPSRVWAGCPTVSKNRPGHLVQTVGIGIGARLEGESYQDRPH